MAVHVSDADRVSLLTSVWPHVTEILKMSFSTYLPSRRATLTAGYWTLCLAPQQLSSRSPCNNAIHAV